MMDISIHEQGKSKIAVIHSENLIIADTQDALDLMATVRHLYECDKIVIPKAAVSESFFDLKTGFAGEILQKYTNYQMKLAIVGSFEEYNSKSLKDFIYESNKGSQVFFVSTEEEALNRLHSVS